jgi:hypothetical protein
MNLDAYFQALEIGLATNERQHDKKYQLTTQNAQEHG